MSNYHVPTLQEFIAFGKTKHFSRADRFAVNIAVPPALQERFGEQVRDINMLCEEAAFPGKQIEPSVVRINGLNELRAHTVDFMGDSITLQFLVDLKWTVRTFFEAWMNQCVFNRHAREVGYYQNYVSHNLTVLSLAPIDPSTPQKRREPWDVIGKVRDTLPNTKPRLNPFVKGNPDPTNTALSEPETVMWGIQIFEAWPRSINVQGVSWGMSQYQRLNVTFAFKNWESFTTDQALLGYIPDASTDPLLSPIRMGVPSQVADIATVADALRKDPANVIGNRFPTRKTVLGKIQPSSI
jgi:hypothetical protein